MKVLVDTCVWSYALRRENPGESVIIEELQDLIRDSRACLINAIRQEILSGIRSDRQFEQLRQKLRFFTHLTSGPEEHELAAKIYNTCRKNGAQGSNTDFLICAVAQIHRVPIFTTDKDFDCFAEHCSIEKYIPRHGPIP